MIGLSLLTLVPGQMGGSETYVRNLVSTLADVGELEYLVFVSTLASDAGGALPTEVVPEYRAGRAAPARARAMAVAVVRSKPFRRRLARASAVHYPLTVPVPPVAMPTAVTLHDVQHVDLPRLFSRAERAFRALAYDRASRRADAVIVPSAFVLERAVDRLGIPPERIHVIPHGIDRKRFSPGSGKREPILLYPARAWPHKNHARLFDAFAELRHVRPELRLVLTGGGHERLTLPAGVESHGHIEVDELASLYQRAACLVFPSLYEGFGAPPLEAMACGCPVAASRAGSLPEVCGDAAVLFDPEDASAIATGVLEALDHAPEFAARGLQRAASFTWQASARAHEAVYRSLSTRS